MSKKEQIVEEEEEKTKWSYWGIGLIAFTVYTVALMFILEATLRPQDSALGAVIAYALGLVGVIGFSILVRKKTRLLVSFPLLLIIVFGIGFLLHLVNAPVYNPFAPISEKLDATINTIEEINNNPNITNTLNISMDQIVQYKGLFIFIDVILSIPLFLLGTIGIAWFADISTKKPKILTILTVLLALFLVVTGVIIFPYIQIITTGFIGVVTNVGAGALYVMDGASILGDFQNATQEEINQAVEKFNISSTYFEQGLSDLKTLKALGLVALLGMMPYVGSMSTGLYALIAASLNIVGGLGPYVNGTYNVLIGLRDVMSAFQGSGLMLQRSISTPTSKQISAIDDNLFNVGVKRLNDGLIILSGSVDNIEQAINELKSVDFDKMYSDMDNMPMNVTEVKEQIKMLRDYISLFEGAATGIRTLVKKPVINGTENQYAVLTHFVYGAYNLFKAGDQIGDTSSFNGTSELLDQAAGNFSVVYSELQSPEIVNLAHSNTPFINDTFNFLTDVTGLTLSLSNLGLGIASAFEQLNGTLSAFDVGYENITDYGTLKTQLGNIVTITDQLTTTATQVDGNISLICTKAQNEEYGQLNEPSSEFSTQLREFNVTKDISNANAIAHAFYYLFGSMEYLKYTYYNVTNGFDKFKNNDYTGALQDFNNANDSLYVSIEQLNNSIAYMNQTEQGGMIQLTGARNALLAIRDGLMSIQADIDYIIEITEGPDPGSHLTEVQQRVNNILNTLKDVNNQLQNVTAQ